MEDGRWPQFCYRRIAVWPCKPVNPGDGVNKKIFLAFRNVKLFGLKRIILQFWRPVKTTSGMRLLSCHRNPYAFAIVNQRLHKYRSLCSRYHYCIDEDWGEVDDPMTITGAPPSRAFLNGFPEVVLDLTLHRGTPLVDLALECELTCFVMIPVFDGTCCLGVVEVSMRDPARLVVIFNELKRELKTAGLSITPPPIFKQPCRARGDFRLFKNEIGKALQVATQSHAITLGQVWIPYQNYCNKRRRTLLGKLTSNAFALSHGDYMYSLKSFYFDVALLPLTKGEGLVGMTLETGRPHLCRDMSGYRGVLSLLSASTKCTSFVICLRSSHTDGFDYVFEFFWPPSHNHLALMEDLLLTLKEYLPGFKYASGAQLGDELLVVDVGSSSSSEGVKLFPGNKLSGPRASLNLKRKSVHDVDQYPLTNISSPVVEDEDDLAIVAVYKVDHRLFFLPSSATYEKFMEKIYQEFELNQGATYKIEYQVIPGEWHGLTDVTSLKGCISSYQTSKNIDHIKLYVEAMEKY